MVTARSGAALRLTATCMVLPSATERVADWKLTFISGWSLSTMVMTVCLFVSSETRVGSEPKVIFTVSPPSSTVSSVAVKLKVCSVSPESKVTLAGMPE